MVLLKSNCGSLNLNARDSPRLSLLRDWVFILFRWIAGYGSLSQPSHRSPPISSPPKTVRPLFPCSARRQHRRVLPTGRKVLPYPVGPFDYPQVWIPQPCALFLIFSPDAELSLQTRSISSFQICQCSRSSTSIRHKPPIFSSGVGRFSGSGAIWLRRVGFHA